MSRSQDRFSPISLFNLTRTGYNHLAIDNREGPAWAIPGDQRKAAAPIDVPDRVSGCRTGGHGLPRLDILHETQPIGDQSGTNGPCRLCIEKYEPSLYILLRGQPSPTHKLRYKAYADMRHSLKHYYIGRTVA